MLSIGQKMDKVGLYQKKQKKKEKKPYIITVHHGHQQSYIITKLELCDK